MTEAEKELLEKVKSALGITGTFQDNTLAIYIDEVKAYMLDAGVKQTIIDSSASVGVIVRGVADLWNYGSGDATLSTYFMQRVIQLAFIREPESEVAG
jgi:hypothetical protein